MRLEHERRDRVVERPKVFVLAQDRGGDLLLWHGRRNSEQHERLGQKLLQHIQNGLSALRLKEYFFLLNCFISRV